MFEIIMNLVEHDLTMIDALTFELERVGVGALYAKYILDKLGIDPDREASSLELEEARRLFAYIEPVTKIFENDYISKSTSFH